MKKLAVLAVCSALVVGCKTSPTGRTQMTMYSPAQMQQLGQASFEEMKKQQKVNKDAALNAYVSCVADKITAELPGQYAQQQWEVVVFEEPSANAFALPGGKIGVHTGLLKVATNQHQLAAVLGHEVGHVIAEHANERISRQALLQTGMQIAGTVLDMNQVSYRNEIMQGLGLGAQFGLVLPFSRTHESEADGVGLDLMARAGFDPRESVALWQNMMAAGSGAQPEFLSTHPAPQNRIGHLQQEMDKALTLKKSANSAGKRPNCTR